MEQEVSEGLGVTGGMMHKDPINLSPTQTLRDWSWEPYPVSLAE